VFTLRVPVLTIVLSNLWLAFYFSHDISQAVQQILDNTKQSKVTYKVSICEFCFTQYILLTFVPQYMNRILLTVWKYLQHILVI
jgi:hypothetical protein